MIRSMTGYARVERETPWGLASWDLRSVNHRFLDVSQRLPEVLRAAENDFRQRISKDLKRGKVDATLRLRADGVVAQPIDIDTDRLAVVADACRQISASMGSTATPDPLRILEWPGVVKPTQLDTDALHSVCDALLVEAIAELNQARETEGKKLAAVLDDCCSALLEHVAAVEARMPQVQIDWRGRLDARMADLGDKADPGRLEQETLLMAQKMDVAEELQRLGSHVSEMREIINRRGVAGRKLDFFLQECNREANTLGSKSQDGEITRYGVAMKVLIEQMREQVQNIE